MSGNNKSLEEILLEREKARADNSELKVVFAGRQNFVA